MAAILFKPEQNGRHLADIFKYILFEIFFFASWFEFYFNYMVNDVALAPLVSSLHFIQKLLVNSWRSS